MQSWLAWLIATVGIATSVFLWFRDVRRIMRERSSTVESAQGQLTYCRKKAVRAITDPGAATVLNRSEKIYRQAVDLYNQTMKKPWVLLPALLMGYHVIK